MELTTFKVAGLVGATTATSAGVYGVYYGTSLPSETIRSKLRDEFKDTNVIFLEENHSEGANLQERFSKIPNKPKSIDGKDLDLNGVKTGCTDNIDKPFKGMNDSAYQQVKSFCFVNVNTFLSELKGKSLITGEKNGVEWQNAWERYKAGSLAITVVADNDKLNGSRKEDGGPILHDGCHSNSQKKMYSEEVDISFPRFKAWCIN